MANLITLSRLFLLLVVVAIAYRPVSPVQLWIWPVLSLVFISDGLDGWVARRRGEESLFGALFDIAVDRIVELTLWIVLADLDVIPIWIPILFVVRGVLVDAIRASQVQEARRAPFSLLNSPIARWLVAGALHARVLRGHQGGCFCRPFPDQAFAAGSSDTNAIPGGCLDANTTGV